MQLKNEFQVKEEVYLKEYEDVWEAESSLRRYFYFYNHQRPHQSLKNKTPFEIYQAGLKTQANKEQKEPIFDYQKLSLKSHFAV